MAPRPGSIHRRPRSDSGAALLWEWARSRRRPWTAAEAAEGAEIDTHRARKIITALRHAGMIALVSEGGGFIGPSTYRVAPAHRHSPAPVLVASPGGASLVGVRVPGAGKVVGPDRIRGLKEASGLTRRALCAAIGVGEREMARLLNGETVLTEDDPVWPRLQALAGGK